MERISLKTIHTFNLQDCNIDEKFRQKRPSNLCIYVVELCTRNQIRKMYRQQFETYLTHNRQHRLKSGKIYGNKMCPKKNK